VIEMDRPDPQFIYPSKTPYIQTRIASETPSNLLPKPAEKLNGAPSAEGIET
jgi:hypothetical protein